MRTCTWITWYYETLCSTYFFFSIYISSTFFPFVFSLLFFSSKDHKIKFPLELYVAHSKFSTMWVGYSCHAAPCFPPFTCHFNVLGAPCLLSSRSKLTLRHPREYTRVYICMNSLVVLPQDAQVQLHIYMFVCM